MSLLERDAELAQVDGALAAAGHGAGGLLLIEGQAGIGKSSLLLAAQRRAEAAGYTVVAARGSELEREYAFGVVRQLLEPAVARDDPERLLAGAAGLAAPLFEPTDASASPDLTFSVLHGLYWLCANLAQSRPLIVMVDDAQWADEASLRFVAYLGQRLDGLPLALIVAARPPEDPAADDIVARLGRHPYAVRLAPAPLSAAATADLIAAETGREPDPGFAAACNETTRGVPLLVRELVRALVREGVEPVDASVARARDIGPETIARYVVARVRRLTPDAERVAQAVAVLGRDAEPARTLRLAGVASADGPAAIDALVLAGIVTAAERIDFVHPIVRAAIYDRLAPGERTRLHARAAALMAEEGAPDERVASHLLAAGPQRDAGVVEVLRRTARAATARGAPDSAAAYLARALQEPPPPGVRRDVLRELGVAELHSGLIEAAAEHLREALSLTPRGPERARVAQDLTGCLRLQWRLDEAVRVIQQTLDETPAEDTDLALSLRAERLLLDTLEPAGAAATDERSVPAGRTLAAGKYLAALYTESTLYLTRDAAQTRKLAAAANAAGIVEDLHQGGSLWTNAVAPLMIADGFALADEMIAAAFAASAGAASIIFTARAYVMRAMLRFRQGALLEAEADAQAALDIASVSWFYFTLLSPSVLLEARAARGALDEAEATVERLELGGELPDSFVHNWVLQARGQVRLAQGRIGEAIADFEELGARMARRGHRNPAMHPYRSGLALALLRDGQVERARVLAREEVDLARLWGAPRALGMALRTAGLCEGDEALLRESVDALAGSGAELEHARSLVELGAAVRRGGRPSVAQDALRHGMELAHRCGATALVEQAREELLATGARPRRLMRSGIDALTPSELRVVRLAAAGRTNREIAQELFVTLRTVESHLTHAFQKLDVSARGELKARL